MKVALAILAILWLISVVIWFIYFVKTIISFKKDSEYLENCLKMVIVSLFINLFNIIMQIVR